MDTGESPHVLTPRLVESSPTFDSVDIKNAEIRSNISISYRINMNIPSASRSF